MAQKIKQASIWGRIGSGVGRGLAESLPKEMERGRLSEGLKRFETESQGLSPLQQYARAASIPGITNQMLSDIPRLAKLENTRNAYANLAGTGTSTNQIQQPDRYQDNQILENNQSRKPPALPEDQGRDRIQKGYIGEEGDPRESVRSAHPLRASITPRIPYSPTQMAEKVKKYQNLGFQPDQAIQLSEKEQSTYLATPGVEEQIESRQEKAKNQADSLLNEKIKAKLQIPKDSSGYDKLPGVVQEALKTELDNSLVKNPNKSLEQVTDELSQLALRLSESDSIVNKLQAKGIFEAKGTDILDNLVSARVPYEKLGLTGKKLYKNDLESKFGFSPEKSSQIAFTRSPKMSSHIQSYKRPKKYQEMKSDAVKQADFVINNLGKQDSLLAILASYREKNPDFDSREFFNYLRNNSDSLNSYQLDELGQGFNGIIPTWADFRYFPFTGRSSASD